MAGVARPNRPGDPVRILMIGLRYPPVVGGTERALRTLAVALAARGHAVDVVTGVDPGVRPTTDDGVSVVSIPLPVGRGRGARFVARAAGAARVLRRPDVVHAHMATAPAMAGVVLSRRHGCPLVVKPSSAGGMAGGNLGDVRARRMPSLRVGVLRREVAAWAAVSAEIEHELVSVWRVPPHRVFRIPNPVDTTLLHSAPAVRRPSPPWRFLYVGRLDPSKGVDLLLDAWRRAGEPGELTIVGDGPERHRLESVAASVSRSVRFLGSVADPAPFYADADVFVLPSRREGLSNALVEAVLAGVPAIATSVGETPALLGSSGRLVPAGDVAALASALASGPPPAADRVAAAERFAADVVAEQHEQLYRSLVSGSASRRSPPR